MKCQVYGCEELASYMCSEGFHYCKFHKNELGSHGTKGKLHTFHRIKMYLNGEIVKAEVIKQRGELLLDGHKLEEFI